MQIIIKPAGVIIIVSALTVIAVLVAKRAQLAGDSSPVGAASGVSNVARSAKVTVSSNEGGYSQAGLNDGLIDGYPDNKSAEWSSDQVNNASCTLTWDSPQTIDRIRLYDRINPTDQVTSGVLTFSDGSTLAVGTLPNNDRTPLDLKFTPKKTTFVTFRITGMRPKSEHAGLAELEIFRANQKS